MKKIRFLKLLIIMVSIYITPNAINYANQIRHYKAFGGEYLIPVFGIVIVYMIETAIETYRNIK